MNKALDEVVKNATPQQLETLKEGKDIKSLLSSVFQDKISSSKSDTLLLDLLKNSSAFKQMGNLSDSLSTLIKELKNSPDFTAKSAVLENFLKNITTIDPQSLKSQIANSGVFMESKIAHALEKIPNLTQTLEQLKTTLSKDPSPMSKTLQEKITTLLSSPQLKTASNEPQSALTLSNSLKEMRTSLTALLSKSDPLYSAEVRALSQQLDTHTTVQELKSTLSQLYGSLLRSNTSETNTLLDGIEKLLKTLSSSSGDELKTFSETLKSAIHEGNITKEASAILAKLGDFTNPKELMNETFLKESMREDLKSNLLTLTEELKTSTEPNASKILDQADKLLSVIDYHQLTSSLSASNSLYFPFSWDQLEEGSLAFKKSKNQKFYCEINLRLKEYGELNLMMALYEENQLEIQVHTEKEELKNLIQENIAALRSVLIEAQLTPRTIRIHHRDEKGSEQQMYEGDDFGSSVGFEVIV